MTHLGVQPGENPIRDDSHAAVPTDAGTRDRVPGLPVVQRVLSVRTTFHDGIAQVVAPAAVVWHYRESFSGLCVGEQPVVVQAEGGLGTLAVGRIGTVGLCSWAYKGRGCGRAGAGVDGADCAFALTVVVG